MIFYGRGLNETVFMIFEPKQRSRKMSVSFPKFKLGGSLLEFVKSVKYLGHMITATLADDWDIYNGKFAICSPELTYSLDDLSNALQMLKLVKVFLYDAGLWFQYSAVVLSKPVTDL